MNDQLFQGKTVVVTGASKGLGRCIALMFAQHGANVVLNGRSAGPLDALASEIVGRGSSAMPVTGDVAIAADWIELLDRTAERFGRVDILVNNAGIMGNAAALHKIDEAEFDAVMATNIRGTWLGMKYA